MLVKLRAAVVFVACVADGQVEDVQVLRGLVLVGAGGLQLIGCGEHLSLLAGLVLVVQSSSEVVGVVGRELGVDVVEVGQLSVAIGHPLVSVHASDACIVVVATKVESQKVERIDLVACADVAVMDVCHHGIA